MGKQVQTIITFRCDECHKEVNKAPSQEILVDLPCSCRDGSKTLAVTIQVSDSYAYGYGENTLCDDCKIVLLRKAIDQLEKSLSKNG